MSKYLGSFNRWRVAMLMVATLLLSSPLVWGQAPSRYTLATFPMWSNVVAKNGTVGGSYQGVPGRWKPGWTAPQVLPGAVLPGEVYGVNRLDQYVGYQEHLYTDGQWKAFFYGPTRTSVATMRLPAGTEFSYAVAINDVGEVIGSAWSSQWGMHDLKLLRWTTPTAMPIIVWQGQTSHGPTFQDINRHGLAMGRAATGQPFLHARGAASLTYLPESAQGSPFAINSLGWLAGADGQVWFPSGATTHLPLWCPPGAGTPWKMDLYGINQQVSVVGLVSCLDPATNQIIEHAIRADDVPNSPAWVMHDLTALAHVPGCHLNVAHGLSEAGHITGSGVCHGVQVGWLLTPVVNTAAVE
jgi:hypothetical protein